jgi:hypothetical protein
LRPSRVSVSTKVNEHIIMSQLVRSAYFHRFLIGFAVGAALILALRPPVL